MFVGSFTFTPSINTTVKFGSPPSQQDAGDATAPTLLDDVAARHLPQKLGYTGGVSTVDPFARDDFDGGGQLVGR